MPSAPTEQRYMSTAFGVLRDVHWPYRSSTVARFEHKEAAGCVKVLQVDALPVNVRRLLGDECLRIAKKRLGMSPEAISQHQSPGGHGVLTQRLLRGQDVFSPSVDPMLSRHFLVGFATRAMEYNLEGRNYLWRYMADTLAAIRLTPGVPAAVQLPSGGQKNHDSGRISMADFFLSGLRLGAATRQHSRSPYGCAHFAPVPP
jgi:hypothetical protein